MKEEENKIGYWGDKKMWAKAIALSCMSLFAVVPIYLLLKAIEKAKIKKEKEKKN